MRLINTTTLELEFFVSNTVPPYAILSHTWGSDELTLQEFDDPKARLKVGFQKIQYTCDEARRNGIQYAWCDTVCIDKSSSAELSEAINSMWTWYLQAAMCYAYLNDVSMADIVALNRGESMLNTKQQPSTSSITVPNSRWTTRGWTLQELLAPVEVQFFSSEWTLFGTRSSLAPELSQHTNIDIEILQGHVSISNASTARKMSWASSRNTTRIEDQAYCLMGIFDVNMPLLYGEGEKAFVRLQEEILRISDDESIFAWRDPEADPTATYGLLAKSPKWFANSAQFTLYRDWSKPPTPITSSSVGIAIQVYLLEEGGECVAYIRCRDGNGANVGLTLRVVSKRANQFVRVSAGTVSSVVQMPVEEQQSIYVRQRPVEPRLNDVYVSQIWEFHDLCESKSYRKVAHTDAQGKVFVWKFGSPQIEVSGRPSQLACVYAVMPMDSSGIFCVLIGSGSRASTGEQGSTLSFNVTSAERLGLPSSWIDLGVPCDSYFSGAMKSVVAAYVPVASLGETLTFNSQHHVKIVRAGGEGAERPFAFNMFIQAVESEKTNLPASHILGSRETNAASRNKQSKLSSSNKKLGRK